MYPVSAPALCTPPALPTRAPSQRREVFTGAGLLGTHWVSSGALLMAVMLCEPLQVHLFPGVGLMLTSRDHMARGGGNTVCICTTHGGARPCTPSAAPPLAEFQVLVALVGPSPFAPEPAPLVGVCPGASLAQSLSGLPPGFSSSSHRLHLGALAALRSHTRSLPLRCACCLPVPCARLAWGCNSCVGLCRHFSLAPSQKDSLHDSDDTCSLRKPRVFLSVQAKCALPIP